MMRLHTNRATLFALGMVFQGFLAAGCVVVGGGGTGNENDNTGGSDEAVRVGFTGNVEGRYASATDDDGNEYTFFAEEDENGDPRITEANVRDADGMTVKATLDEQGRPVSVLGADGTRANIVYANDGTAKVALATAGNADGEIVDGVDVGASDTAKRPVTTYRRQDIDDLDFLGGGLDVFDDIAFSLFDDCGSNASPLCDTSLAGPSLEIAALVEIFNVSINIEITTADAIDEIIIIDDVPQGILDLDGSWVLCSRDGIPANELGVENILTFGSTLRADVLVTEFDRQNVFDLSNLFGGGDSGGVEIDYVSRLPLPPQNIDGLELQLTPIYSATSEAFDGRILIDRRFAVATTGTLGDLPLNSEYQINAALTNGELVGDVLTFELVVIDLENDLAFGPPIELTYLRAGVEDCGADSGGDNRLQLFCPALVELFEPAEVAVDVPDNFDAFYVTWYVLNGSAFFEDDASPVTSVIALDDSAPLRIAVSVVDEDGKYADGECYIDVAFQDDGDICENNGYYGDGICDSFCPQEDPDCFDFGVVDLCVENGWYDDGICDEFCLEPDPDCDISVGDQCAENGWYGDGICDDFCLEPDPDCFGGSDDYCEANGYYGDGICDDFCPEPDPDCFGGSGDFCFDNGFYGDGLCDPTCPEPDPDCFDETDACAENGYYNDGICDDFCAEPDPDCFVDDEEDFCEASGYYGDGFCDDFCPEPDPDCFEEEDFCLDNGLYGDGFCDDFCDEPDPDCF